MLIWQAAVMLDAGRIMDKCRNPEKYLSFFELRSYEEILSGYSTYNFVLAIMAKLLLENVDTMYDFRKSELYKHKKFRDVDSSMFETIKAKLLEAFSNEEDFGYMKGYEPWEKLIFEYLQTIS